MRADRDPVRRIDAMPPDLVREHYDRVHRTLGQQRAQARRQARRQAWRTRLYSLAVVLMFVLLLALAGGIERTGW